MDRLESSGESDRVLRMAAALWRFWDLKGHLLEGRSRLDAALSSDDRPTAARATALSGAADMALTGGDVAAGGRLANAALELHGALGDAWGAAFSLLMVAYVVGKDGDWPKRARALRRERRGVPGVRRRALCAPCEPICRLGVLRGRRSRTRAKNLEENLRQARATHDEYIQGVSLSQLAAIAADERRFEDAASMLTESYRILCELNDLLQVATVVGPLPTCSPPPGSGGCCECALEREGAFRGDRREPRVVREGQREDAVQHSRPTRRRRLRRGLGARPGIDRRRGGRARARFTALSPRHRRLPPTGGDGAVKRRGGQAISLA